MSQYFKNIPDGTTSEEMTQILTRVFKEILLRYNYRTDIEMFEAIVKLWIDNEPDALNRFPYLKNPGPIVSDAFLRAYYPSAGEGLDFDSSYDEFETVANEVAAEEMGQSVSQGYERLPVTVLKQLAKERNIIVKRRDGLVGQPLKNDYVAALKVWDSRPSSRSRKSDGIYAECSPSRRNEIEGVSKIGELKNIARKYKVPNLGKYKLADINSLKQIICKAGKVLSKEQADRLLVSQLQELIRNNGYLGMLALQEALSSIISRAEANGEHWAVYYKDNEDYEDNVKDIIIEAARGFEDPSAYQSPPEIVPMSPPRALPRQKAISLHPLHRPDSDSIYSDCSPSERNRLEGENRIGEIKKIAKERGVPNIGKYKLATINSLKMAICRAGKLAKSKNQFNKMLIDKLLNLMREEGRKGPMELHFVLRNIINEATNKGESWVAYYDPNDNIAEEAERLFNEEVNAARRQEGLPSVGASPARASPARASPARATGLGQCSPSLRSKIEGIKTIGELKKIAREHGVPGINKYKLADLEALKQAICNRERVLREEPIVVPLSGEVKHVPLVVEEPVPLSVKEPTHVPLSVKEPTHVPLSVKEPTHVPLSVKEPTHVPLSVKEPTHVPHYRSPMSVLIIYPSEDIDILFYIEVPMKVWDEKLNDLYEAARDKREWDAFTDAYNSLVDQGVLKLNDITGFNELPVEVVVRAKRIVHSINWH